MIFHFLTRPTEHTKHFVLLCMLAPLLWSHLADSNNEATDRLDAGDPPMTLQRDNIMFNQPPSGIPDNQQYDVVQAKHTIYRLKFRQNINNLPTIRLLLVSVALDLERAVTVRNYMREESKMLAAIMERLTIKAGF